MVDGGMDENLKLCGIIMNEWEDERMEGWRDGRMVKKQCNVNEIFFIE